MSQHRGLVAVLGMFALEIGVGCGSSANVSGRSRDGGAPSGAGGQSGAGGGVVGVDGAAGAGGAGTGGAGGVTSQAPGGCAPAAADLPSTPICENSACWVNPRPSGTWWRSAQASSASDVWIAGYGPNSLHFDGQRFQVVQNGLQSTLTYWSFSPTDVWAADSGAIVHGDGTRFAPSAFPAGVSVVGDLWGAAPNDLYASGIPLLHWDGNVWTAVPQVGVAFSVTGSASDDVWAADRSHLFHFDGKSWMSVPLPDVSFFVVDIASAGRGQLWLATVAEATTHIFRYTGTGWSESLVLPSSRNIVITSLVSAGPSQVVAVGAQYRGGPSPHAFAVRWNGASWIELALSQPNSLEGGWIDASGAGYLVGDSGTLLHLAATGVDRSITEGQGVNFTGVWGRAADDVWLVDDQGGSARYDGCTINAVPTGNTTPLTDVWGVGPRDVWAAGAGGVVLHHDGIAWHAVPSGTSADLHAVWAASPDDVWVGGARNTLLRFTPSGVTPVAIPGAAAAPAETVVNDISGSGATDVWIATSNAPGMILRFDGTNWSAPMELPPSSPASTISRIWVYAPNDVWAFAVTGPRSIPFFHFDGSSWTPVGQPVPPGADVIFPPPTAVTPTINNTFAFDPNHILWVGNAGAFLRSQ
jgi:hypothetical protein